MSKRIIKIFLLTFEVHWTKYLFHHQENWKESGDIEKQFFGEAKQLRISSKSSFETKYRRLMRQQQENQKNPIKYSISKGIRIRKKNDKIANNYLQQTFLPFSCFEGILGLIPFSFFSLIHFCWRRNRHTNLSSDRSTGTPDESVSVSVTLDSK